MTTKRITIIALIILAFAAGHASAAIGYKRQFDTVVWEAANDIVAFAESFGQQACVTITATSTTPTGRQITRQAFRCP